MDAALVRLIQCVARPADLAPPFGGLDFTHVTAFLVAFGSKNEEAGFAAALGHGVGLAALLGQE